MFGARNGSRVPCRQRSTGPSGGRSARRDCLGNGAIGRASRFRLPWIRDPAVPDRRTTNRNDRHTHEGETRDDPHPLRRRPPDAAHGVRGRPRPRRARGLGGAARAEGGRHGHRRDYRAGLRGPAGRYGRQRSIRVHHALERRSRVASAGSGRFRGRRKSVAGVDPRTRTWRWKDRAPRLPHVETGRFRVSSDSTAALPALPVKRNGRHRRQPRAHGARRV